MTTRRNEPMNRLFQALIVLAGVAYPTNTNAADGDRQAMTAAAREVARQIDVLQELFGTNSQLLMINGLFQQTMDFQGALINFRQKVNGNASNEQIAIAFDTVDGKLTAILAEVKALENDVPALKLVCNRLKSAEHDLHFAVFSGDGTPERQSERLYRQTLAQQGRVESLANNVGWVFARQAVLQRWKDDLDAVQKSLIALQKLEQDKKATPEQIKKQFVAVDRTWSQVVQKYEASKQNKLLLQSSVVQVDQGFGRLAPLAGVKDRRAPLSDGWSN
jgi:hypothetical protein